MQKRHIILILLLFLSVFKTQSQTENYPVSATLVFAAPFSLKVSDYFTSNTRMYLNLNLKDLTKPTLKVYLKWSLEGPGIRISTRDGFIPASFIELNKGVNLQKGSDLGVYFQRGMLDYQGIDEGVVFNGSIPEGFYTMKFQALEANSGRDVSNLTESFFFVTSPQPPIITQPFNGSIVPVSNPQNVLLQWTPRQISTLESQVVYEVTIYEVAEGDDPVVVANSGILPKFNRTVSTTSTLMGASDLPLQEGKRYAMVVTAKDLNGKMNFENGGKSEVSWFQYGKGCFAPAGLDVAETAPGKVILSWTPNTTAEGYVIEHKKKTESTWIINGSTYNSFTLNGLSPKTDYEFRVKTQCSGGKYSAYTATESVSVIGLITPTPETEVSLADVLDPFSQTVSTKSDGKPFDPKNIDALLALLKPPACAVSGVSYVCGQTPSATPPVGIDLTTLAKGDVLGIYDYAVLVTEVSNGSSPFAGKGLVKLPFAGGIKVPVEFKGIKAKKGEDGKDGGCVWYVPADLNEGYFQVKGSQQDAIVKEQEKLLADIYSELIDPQSFYGTFEEALAKYEAKSKEIEEKEAKGEVVDKKDYQELVKYLHGVVQGGSDWKAKLVKTLGSNASEPEIKDLLAALDKVKTDLEECEKCVVSSLITPPSSKGGGPHVDGDDDYFLGKPCKIETGISKRLKDIQTSLRQSTIWTFIQKCYADYKNQKEGIVPRCLWDHGNNVPYVADMAFSAGVVDGLLETGKGLFDLAGFIDCYNPTSSRAWFDKDCKETRDKTVIVLGQISEVFSSKDNFTSACGSVWSVTKSYFNETASFNNQARYNQGKLIFNVASLFIGVGEAKAILAGETTILQVIKASAQGFARMPASLGRLFVRGSKDIAQRAGAYLVMQSGNKSAYLAYQLSTTELRLATLTERQILTDIHWATNTGALVEKIENVSYLNKAGKEAQGTLEVVKDASGKYFIREGANIVEKAFKNIAKYALNIDDLGKMAMNYRKVNNLWHDGNVVVFEFINNEGKIEHLVQSTLANSGKHSERLAIEVLEAKGIPLQNIKKIYSELELCELNSGGTGIGGCKKMILDKVGENVEIRYSYAYPGNNISTKPLREASIDQRRIDFKKFK